MLRLGRSRFCLLTTLGVSTLAVLSPCRGELPPIRLSGSLGYELRYDWSENGETVLTNALVGRLNAATYIWQPWLAQTSGGVSLRLSDAQGDDRESTNIIGSAEGRLRLFPVSRFPFEVFFDYRNNVVDDNLFDSNFEILRYGFSQRYMPQGGGLNLGLRYEHSDRSSDQDRGRGERNLDQEESNDFFEMTAERNFGDLNTRWVSRYERNTANNPEQDETRLFSMLRHQYPMTSNATLSGQIIYRDDLLDFNSNERSNQRWEFNEYLFWRPETEKPLLLTAAVRYLDNTIARNIPDGDSDEISIKSLNSNLGASYQLSPHWQFSANVTSTLTEDADGEQTTSASETLQVSYDPAPIPLGKSEYRWFATLGVRAEQEPDQNDEENLITGEMGLGHSISRGFQFDGGSSLQLRLTQSGNLGQDTADGSFYWLEHGANLNWSYNSGKANTLLSLNAIDTRSYEQGINDRGEQESESQFISLQLSRSQSLDRYSSWSGNVSIQLRREQQEDRSRFPDLEDNSEDDDYISPNALIELNYRNQRLFDIRNLTFESKLRLYSDSYLPLLDDTTDPEDEEGQVWDNRLQYRIGRLDLLLLGRLSRINEELDGLIFFELRRNFDTIY